MPYVFDQIFAVDEANPQNVARNASVLLYQIGDATKAPVTITTPSGEPLPNPVIVNANGFGPIPMHETLDSLAWEGGGHSGVMHSYRGMKDEAVAARTEAEAAKVAAEAAAADTVTTGTVNGAGRLILTKADLTTVDAGEVVGPQGLPGTPGQNGSNVLTTDEAIAQSFNTPGSAARGAADARYAMSDTFKRIVAGGSNTTGDNIRVGNFAYGPTDVGTTYVQGGATNYENVIGGNTANVNTATSNLTGAAALVAPNGNWSAILHGYDNVNNGWANVLTGFHCQMVAGSNHGTIAGGSDQKILGTNAAYATISGGTGHTVSASGGTVSGGTTNTASGTQSTVAGGLTNTASGAQAVIGGGQNNIASGSLATVTGGNANEATGSNATVSGGTTNKAQNISAVVVGGSSNTASNQYSTVSGGLTNAANGVSSVVPGGRENVATGDYSTASGYKAVASQYGVRAHASGMFAVAGDAQVLDYVLRNTSTDATAKLLYPSGVAFLPAIPDSTLWGFEAMVVGRCNATGESAAYKVTGAIDRGVGVATTALVGTPTVTAVAEDNAAWNVTVSAGTGDGTLRIFGVGEVAKTIRWVCRLEITSVSG